MGLFGSIDESIQAKTAKAISFFGKKIDVCDSFELMRYPLKNVDFYIGITQIRGLDDYTLFFTTNNDSGQLFVFLTDADRNEAIGFLAHLALGAENGKHYMVEEVITVGNEYLRKNEFSGLVFLDPEDMEIFGGLQYVSEIDGVNCKILSFLLLKEYEMAAYKAHGFDAVIQFLSSEERDFLSIK